MKIITICNFYFNDFRNNFLKFAKKAKVDTQTITIHKNSHVGANYGTSDFKRIMLQKMHIIHEQLKRGNRIIYLDIDIVILKNLLPICTDLLNKGNLYFQNDHTTFDYKDLTYPVACAGCLIANPTKENIELFNPEGTDINNMLPTHDDQYIINRRLIDKSINYKMLSSELFPSGKYWYKNHQKLDPYLVHYNWIAGKNEKIRKMKKFNHWKCSRFHTLMLKIYNRIHKILA